ncbi:nitroreductase/quinone reductase family protein [Blastococcus tunisiensis]|uniref:Deazaflavin-dependent oxidoreductase, nitroreductase family n=1 Tax=Blastococcus tunisiensis TaxID=1798228 RepID=A0A1I2MVI2_9ACTN|nr:nitroreductase/quinone reductase family protein [Blastococcus sp. DSM 46838]SFF95585.1 deazaflavin-dependent oxidoreductase, nitroreductase family [Blastococcus sp. DSM 46838]
MLPAADYGPSPVPWVREEVAHLERTGSGLRGRSVVLLTTVGARSGLVRKTPLMRVEHAGIYAAVASTRGEDRHPDWYANVLARPRVVLRDGDLLLDLAAREVSGAERSRWWSLACTVFPSYVEYQRRTRRRIPVLLLEPPDGHEGART